MALAPTPSQTVGPYFAFALPYAEGPFLVAADDPEAVRVFGTVYDGEGAPVDDALLELWQANPEGRYDHPEDTRSELPLRPGFTGFGRADTDAEGHYEFVTLKPGRVPGRGGALQAPHLSVTVFARGLLKHAMTRAYFPDEEAANAEDPVLASIADGAVRATLIARPEDGGLRFDVHLQGDRQTAFFDV